MPTPLTPEQKARRQIDRMLEAAGWQVQSRERINRTAAAGVAVCEFPTTTGPVDYLLFAQGKPIGVVEAKKAGPPSAALPWFPLRRAQRSRWQARDHPALRR